MADHKRGHDGTARGLVPTEGLANLYGGRVRAAVGELLVGRGDDLLVGTC